ncbi:MAG TPA: endo-1,4-beta-xylanase [Steroidobacteraceae bacterium]|nr:endo-1,4-beta-xylanase [Steroidobacteraceae bacterium]
MPHLSRRQMLEAGLSVALAAAPLRADELASEAGPDSLESLAHAKGLHFGTALSSRGLADPRYLELVRSQCGVIVPENELKMPAVQPAPGEFNFERAEALLAFAESNKMLTRGHCLLWHHPRWLPKWLDGYDFGAQPTSAAEKLLSDHIATTTSHFGKRIVSWDVVNEAVDNVTGEMRETPLSKAMGSPDKVLQTAFHAARASLPETELVYNDYMGWETGSAAHRDGVLRLLERFRKTGVPVNALGVQAHLGSGNQDSNANRSFDTRDEKAWRKFLDDVTGMGYSLAVTEFDVHDATLPADFARRDQQVAALGRAFLDLTLSFKQVNVVMCWGLIDTHSWLQGRTPRKDGMPKRPTPYDNHYLSKPLRGAIAAAFRAAPIRKRAAIAGIPA